MIMKKKKETNNSSSTAKNPKNQDSQKLKVTGLDQFKLATNIDYMKQCLKLTKERHNRDQQALKIQEVRNFFRKLSLLHPESKE